MDEVKANKTTAAPAAKAATGGKNISSATIKGLVGTKGYEGYDEAAIQKYYTDNGYNIK
jgi:hypothetical protein